MNCMVNRFTTLNSGFTWNLDTDGFLRCHTTVQKNTVLEYTPEQVGIEGIPERLHDRRVISLLVPEDELSNAASISSLEGKPVSIDHIWQKQGEVDAVGNIAGSPFYDTEKGLLFADILVTDPEAIARITSPDLDSKLVEQSAGYTNNIEWNPGVTDDGKVYDGIQRNIRYNHIALLPQGQGRAGADVRILNSEETVSVSDYTQVRIANSNTDVCIKTEDVEKFNSEISRMVKTINEGEKSVEDIEGQLQEIERLNNEKSDLMGQIEEKDKSLNEYSGSMESLKSRLEDALNPDNMQNALNAAMAEQEDAQRILNSFSTKFNESDKAEVAAQIKTMHGDKLRGYVVNQVRTLNKRDALTDEELKNTDNVKGQFTAFADSAALVSKASVNGTDVVKSLNSSENQEFSTTKSRLAKKFKVNNQKLGIRD